MRAVLILAIVPDALRRERLPHPHTEHVAPPCHRQPRPAGTAACRQSNKFVGGHIQAQLPCLATSQGDWAVDYLGRVESIDEDLNEVLAILDGRRMAGVPPLGTLPKQLGNANGRPCVERDGARGASGEMLGWALLTVLGFQCSCRAEAAFLCLPPCCSKSSLCACAGHY